MASHKYVVGRMVKFVPSELRLSPLGQFEIVRALPIEHGIAQYRIKSLKDGHQRVVMESDLSWTTARRETVEDPGITRLDIDRYRRALKLNLSDTERKEILALLAAAELRMRNGFTAVTGTAEN
jgi:hypothetical protein